MSEGLMSGGGDIRAKLLWTNPSPTSAFPAQSFSFDVSDYDSLMIESITDTSYSTDARFRQIIQKTTTEYNTVCAATAKGKSALTSSRSYIAVNGVLSCGQGCIYAYGSNDEWCIPLRIWGIKGLSKAWSE